MSNFKVGQRIVSLTNFEGIAKNEIYTISKITACKCRRILLSLVEISAVTPHIGTMCKCSEKYYSEYMYSERRFRPLDEEFAENVLREITRQVKVEELENAGV